MISTKPLSAADIRDLARWNAELLGELIDTVPCGHDLDYDQAFAVACHTLTKHALIFCEVIWLGTELTPAEMEATPYAELFKIGCAVIEATREAWRPAWPNGFLQRILIDELRPHSQFVQGVAR